MSESLSDRVARVTAGLVPAKKGARPLLCRLGFHKDRITAWYITVGDVTCTRCGRTDVTGWD